MCARWFGCRKSCETWGRGRISLSYFRSCLVRISSCRLLRGLNGQVLLRASRSSTRRSTSRLSGKHCTHQFEKLEANMAVEIRVPEMGESVVDATVGSWLKHQGDTVEKGEALVELETDKVNVEVSAEQSGVLQEILKQE